MALVGSVHGYDSKVEMVQWKKAAEFIASGKQRQRDTCLRLFSLRQEYTLPNYTPWELPLLTRLNLQTHEVLNHNT